MQTITLTPEQAARYDSDDESISSALLAELRPTYGRSAAGEAVETEIRHPDGYIIECYTRRTA